jgi:transcriptional regulator
VLITHGDEGLDANHLPFELLADQGSCGTLIGHVARANPLWREASEGLDVLVVFRAEEAYLSPNWYPGKHEHHRQVPTWNYRVVHAHGRLRVRDEEKFVRGVVARLTRTHEARAGAEKPWKITDSSPEFIEQMLAAIVGIEIELTRLEGKFKLSQNKDARDIEGAAQGLQAQGKLQLAEQMRAAGSR